MPNLIKHQFDFLQDRRTPHLAFSGGMGSGKSLAGALKGLDLAISNPGEIGIVWGPTIRDAKDGIIRNMVQILRGEHPSGFEVNLPFDYNKGTGQINLFVRGRSKPPSEIYVRSGEQDIVGTNAGWAIADELDTLSKAKARHNFQQLTQRIRSKTAPVKQLCATTTPEGYKFLWEYFVQEPTGNPDLLRQRRLITASLLANPHVEDSYIQNLIATHTPAQQRARIHGEFVNLGQSRVYEYFDRGTHHTNLTLADFPEADLYVGWDFNVTKMAAVIGVRLPDKLLLLAEHIGTKENPILDTPTMIRLLKKTYPDRTIFVCPDASGENRNANGYATSITEIQRAGFVCLHDKSNPLVELRVSNVNRMLYATSSGGSPELYVNTKFCPFVTDVLEQQPYNDKGAPDKEGGLDHAGDAVGYLVCQTFGDRLAAASTAPWRH